MREDLEDVVVTRVFANDLTYQVLSSDGSIWSWEGNNYGGIRAVAKKQLPEGFVVTDSSSGTHWIPHGSIWGWGVALGQTTCTLL